MGVIRVTQQYVEVLASRAQQCEAESDVSLGQAADRLGVFTRDASSALSLGQDVSSTKTLSLSAASLLAVATEAEGGFRTVSDVAAASVLTLGQGALGGLIQDLSAGSILGLGQECTTTNVLARAVASALILDQTLGVARPWYVSADTVLQETHQEFVPGTLEIVEVTTGLHDAASVNASLNRAALSPLAVAQHANFSFIQPGGIVVSADSILDLSDDAWITQLGIASTHLAMGQSAAVHRGSPLDNELDVQQAAGVTAVRSRSAETELDLGQAVTYVLVRHGAVDLFGYAPAGSGPIPGTLQGPFPGVTSPFALIYPAEGAATDTVELRPPNLGNKDRLSFDRINRESRGGTLTVFADPDWPKVQTLVLSFSALYRDEAYELVRFIRDHLGLEIRLSDWEQRVWKGVITTPDQPIVQDGKDSFSAGFEFEGELLSA